MIQIMRKLVTRSKATDTKQSNIQTCAFVPIKCYLRPFGRPRHMDTNDTNFRGFYRSLD